MMDQETKLVVDELRRQLEGLTAMSVEWFLDFQALQMALAARDSTLAAACKAARQQLQTLLGAGFQAEAILRKAEGFVELRRRLAEFEGEPQ